MNRIRLDFRQHLYIPTENADRNWWWAIVSGMVKKNNKMFIKRIRFFLYIQLKVILLTALTGRHPTSYNQFLK